MRNKWFVFAGLIVLWAASHLSPKITIRDYMFFHLHPIGSMTAAVIDTGRRDWQYGEWYDVRGFVDRETGDEIGVFYLKKLGPFWYVTSAGTGP